ncbi:10450_t:CDS:2, partial [Funneliformis caledonium]
MSYRRSKNSNSTVFSTFPSKRNRNKFGLCPTCKSSRPSAHDIYQTLHTWYWNLKDGDGNAVTKSFINADSNDFQSSTPASSRPVTQTHPLAVYTSRLLNFHDLPEPVNALHTTGRRIPITSSVGIVSNDSLEEYRTRQLDDELSF